MHLRALAAVVARAHELLAHKQKELVEHGDTDADFARHVPVVDDASIVHELHALRRPLTHFFVIVVGRRFVKVVFLVAHLVLSRFVVVTGRRRGRALRGREPFCRPLHLPARQRDFVLAQTFLNALALAVARLRLCVFQLLLIIEWVFMFALPISGARAQLVGNRAHFDLAESRDSKVFLHFNGSCAARTRPALY